MTTDERPRIGDIVSRALSSTWQGLLGMPMLFISSYVGTLAALFGASYFGNPIATSKSAISGAGSVVAGLTVLAEFFLGYFAYMIFLAPVAVAMHRLIIRGDLTKGPVSIFPVRTRMFIFWLVLIELVRMLYVVPAAIDAANNPRHWMTLVFVYAAAIGVGVVAVRISLLFPAIAIDAPSGSLVSRAQTSWEQTRGHFWYIFWIGLVIAIIVAVPLGVVIAFFVMGKIISQTLTNGKPPDPNIVVHVMTEGPVLALSALQYVAVTAAAAAGLSWIYRALVERSFLSGRTDPSTSSG